AIYRTAVALTVERRALRWPRRGRYGCGVFFWPRGDREGNWHERARTEACAPLRLRDLRRGGRPDQTQAASRPLQSEGRRPPPAPTRHRRGDTQGEEPRAVPRGADEGHPRVRHPEGGRGPVVGVARKPLLSIGRVHRSRDLHAAPNPPRGGRP